MFFHWLLTFVMMFKFISSSRLGTNKKNKNQDSKDGRGHEEHVYRGGLF